MTWFIKDGPIVHEVLAAGISIDDHFGPEHIGVTEWANGEGLQVDLVPEKGPDKRIELTWQEWTAIKKAVRAIQDRQKSR